MKPDERHPSAVAFLRAAIAYFASLGVSLRRVLTDNGPAFRSRRFAAACWRLGLCTSSPDPDFRPIRIIAGPEDAGLVHYFDGEASFERN